MDSIVSPLASKRSAGTVAAARASIAVVALAFWCASWPALGQIEGRDGSPPGTRQSPPVRPLLTDHPVGRGCSEGSPAATGGWAGGGCPNNCTCGWCGPFASCWPPLNERLWFRGDYLLWWTKGSELAPMLTASPAGTPPDEAGVLGQSGTRVLFGDTAVNTSAHSGERLTLGYWLEPFQCTAIEASYLGMGRETARYGVSSPGIAILARPYFDAESGTQAAMLIAYPDLLRGSASAIASSEFQTVEVLLRHNLYSECGQRTDFLLGWRFAQLDETLRLSHSSRWTAPQGVIIPGTTKQVVDLFDTGNRFNGVELGVVHREQFGRWSLDTQLRIDLGNNHSRVLVDGMTTTAVPAGGSADFLGGLLTQQTNIGSHERDRFAVIPEVGVALGCDLTCRLRATFGYSFLYWGKVARPAALVDASVSQLPPEIPTGAERPRLQLVNDSFWAQGLQFGLDFRF